MLVGPMQISLCGLMLWASMFQLGVLLFVTALLDVSYLVAEILLEY
jgi:hypothetical protein